MTVWGNTDSPIKRPKFSLERRLRPATVLTANATAAKGNANIIFVSVTNANAGQYVTGNNINTISYLRGYFQGNVTALWVGTSNVTIRISSVLTDNVFVGELISFDNTIPYRVNSVGQFIYDDTILVTPTRKANARVNIANVHTGWVHVRKKTNSDGTIRYMTEVLVAMSNVVAANTNSGNTHDTQIYAGV